MTDTAQLRTLLERKECAAYALVEVAQIACAYLNVGEITKAQNLLQGAVLDYQLAEQRITEFQKSNLKKENSAHGEQSAA